MVALLLTVGVWLWAVSGEASAGTGTSEAAAASDGSGEPAAVTDTSEDAEAISYGSPAVVDGSQEEPAVSVVETAGSAGFVAKSYARDYSVSVGEAGRRLSRIALLQKVMGSIRALEASRVAGWGIDHGEDFGAWVWLAGDAGPGVEAARVADAHDDVEIRTGATHTYEVLRAAQDRIDPTLVEDDLELSSKIATMVVSTGIDMAANSVTVGVDSGSGSARSRRDATSGVESDADESFTAEASMLREVLQEYMGVGVEIIDASGFSNTANFRSGEALYTCTAGFAAKQVGGPYGILTAGHCDAYQIMHRMRLPYVVGSDGTRADAQFHRIPFGSSRELTNDYKCGANAGSVCEVTGTAKRVDMMGEYVCHTGRNSGVSCGEITDITYSPSKWKVTACRDEDGNKAKCEPVFVKVHGPKLRACKGDSGSPVYNADGIAYGVTKGMNTGTKCDRKGANLYFSAIDEVEDFLDVKVLTVPPSAPGAPQNLQGHLMTMTAGGLKLTWTPSEGATGYLVYRRVSGSDKNYELIGRPRKPRYVDSYGGLSTGYKTHYIVKAATNAKASEPSNDFQVNTMTTKEIRAVLSADGSRIDLSWKPTHPDGNENDQLFEIYRRRVAPRTAYNSIGREKCCSAHDTISELFPAEYAYRVKPINTPDLMGSWGSSSNYATVRIPVTRPHTRPILGDTILPDWPSFRGVVVSWDKLSWDKIKDQVVLFTVQRRAAIEGQPYAWIGSIRAEENIYYDYLTELTPGMEYYYRIHTFGNPDGWTNPPLYASVRVPALTDLQASMNPDPTMVTVTWAEPIGDVARYEVYRRAAIQGQPYAKIGQTETGSYSDPSTGLIPGVEYYYRVKAVGTSGLAGSWGPGSNYARVVAPAVGGLEAASVSGGVSVSWTEPTGDVADYEVYRRAAIRGLPYTKIGDTTTASYSDPLTGLVPGVEYYYRVKAVSAAGVVGSWGTGKNYASVVAPAVGGIKATAVSGGISVTWTQPAGDIARYEVYRRVAVQGQPYTKIGETTTAPYLDRSTNLTPRTEYYYRVKPVGANGVVGGWGPGPNYASIRFR